MKALTGGNIETLSKISPSTAALTGGRHKNYYECKLVVFRMSPMQALTGGKHRNFLKKKPKHYCPDRGQAPELLRM